MIDTYIQVTAWIGFTLWILLIIVEPALFGTERKPYSFGAWIAKIILGVPLTLPIYLRVLGFI